MACFVAVIGFASQDKVEAASVGGYCIHQDYITGYSIVGAYTDTHVVCTKCNELCTRYHEILRTSYCCKNCHRSTYYDEDLIRTHSANICKELLNLK